MIFIPSVALRSDAYSENFTEAQAKHRVFDKGKCWRCAKGEACSDLGLCEDCRTELREECS